MRVDGTEAGSAVSETKVSCFEGRHNWTLTVTQRPDAAVAVATCSPLMSKEVVEELV
jgi:hypothetical protein